MSLKVEMLLLLVITLKKAQHTGTLLFRYIAQREEKKAEMTCHRFNLTTENHEPTQVFLQKI